MEGVPKVDGCAMVRSVQDLVRLFGDDAVLLRQNTQKCTFADQEDQEERGEGGGYTTPG